ncbi:MAG TPA: hypothetical protein VH520_04320, partial [Streptosporangiaceae bacterium]
MLDNTAARMATRARRRPIAVPGGCALALLVATTLGSLATPQAAEAASTPTFVQQASAHGGGKSSISATTGASVASGDRLVVEVGIWSSKAATTSSVTDSLGNTFVEVTHFTAADNTEMSIWTAPVPTGGSVVTVTAKSAATADMGIIVLDYSGMSPVADVTAVDQSSH